MTNSPSEDRQLPIHLTATSDCSCTDSEPRSYTFLDRLLEPQWGRDRKGRLSDWPVLAKHVFFLICLKNMTFWEMAPFSLGGGKFFRWKWQLTPSSGLKRRWKVRNVVTDYTVLYIHGSVHRESNLITVQQDATYSVYYFHFITVQCDNNIY